VDVDVALVKQGRLDAEAEARPAPSSSGAAALDNSKSDCQSAFARAYDVEQTWWMTLSRRSLKASRCAPVIGMSGTGASVVGARSKHVGSTSEGC
jgi:hypothetical protein